MPCVIRNHIGISRRSAPDRGAGRILNHHAAAGIPQRKSARPNSDVIADNCVRAGCQENAVA